MDNKIKAVIAEYKEKLALSTVNDFFIKENNAAKNSLFYQIILSFLCDLEDSEQLEEKFLNFKKLKDYIYLHQLFYNTMKIGKNKNEELIDDCIKEYNFIINDEKYKELSEINEYKIPDTFNVPANYLDESLINNINLFNNVYNELEIIIECIKKNSIRSR